MAKSTPEGARSGDRMTNLNGGMAWIRTAITILGFVLSALTAGLVVMDRVNARFEDLRESQHAAELRLSQLEGEVAYATRDRWTAKHMITWAARLDRANGAIDTPDPSIIIEQDP